MDGQSPLPPRSTAGDPPPGPTFSGMGPKTGKSGFITVIVRKAGPSCFLDTYITTIDFPTTFSSFYEVLMCFLSILLGKSCFLGPIFMKNRSQCMKNGSQTRKSVPDRFPCCKIVPNHPQCFVILTNTLPFAQNGFLHRNIENPTVWDPFFLKNRSEREKMGPNVLPVF